MHLSLQTNSAALGISRHMRQNSSALAKSMQRLSSGYRINTAADAPADLAAADKLSAQIEGLEKAIRSTNQTQKLLQLADGALGEVQNLLQKMRELAVGSANQGVISSDQLAANQAEMDAALQGIERILASTNLAGTKLLDNLHIGTKNSGGSAGDADSAGEDDEDGASQTLAEAGILEGFGLPDGGVKLDAEVTGFTERDLASRLSLQDQKLLQVSEMLTGISAGGLGGVAVTGCFGPNGAEETRVLFLADMFSGGLASLERDPSAAMQISEKALKEISAKRAEIAAIQTYRLQADENNMLTELENLTRTESYLRDTDYSAEIAEYTRAQIFSQMSVSMMYAAQMNKKSVLNLLQF